MTAAPVDVLRGPLAAAVSRRSPRVHVALDREQAGATARAWAQRVFPGQAVEAVMVGSVLYRPDGSCTLRYRARVAPEGRELLLLVVVPRAEPASVVHAFPADPALPTLARALDAVLMQDVLGHVLPGTVGRPLRHCAVDVVRYPRQGRCVVRYRLAPGAGDLPYPVVFGKVYADATAAAAAAALQLLGEGVPLLPADLRFAVPRPLGVVGSLRLGLAEAIPGRPLLPDLLKAACDSGDGFPAGDREALENAVGAAGRLAAAVHAVRFPSSVLPTRDLAGERAATAAALTELEPVWPEVALRLRAGAARALDGPVGWSSAPALAHGDLTPGQVLLDGTARAGLVDVDTTCIAEPALDLGRFLAYLHVTGIRRSRDAWPLLHRLTALFLCCYLDVCPPAVSPAADTRRLLLSRTAAYRALALARMGASACWQLKDDRLRTVLDVLDAGNEWMEA